MALRVAKHLCMPHDKLGVLFTHGVFIFQIAQKCIFELVVDNLLALN